MICQNILRRSSLWDVSTIREIEVRIMRKEKQPDIPGHGFIIKDGISIIMMKPCPGISGCFSFRILD